MKSVIKWAIHAFSIYVAAWLLPGIELESFWTALLVSAVISVINFFLKPILTILSLPFIVVTLGLFLVVINAVLLLLAGDLTPGFEVHGFWPAVWGSLIISAVSYVLNPPDRKKEHEKS